MTSSRGQVDIAARAAAGAHGSTRLPSVQEVLAGASSSLDIDTRYGTMTVPSTEFDIVTKHLLQKRIGHLLTRPSAGRPGSRRSNGCAAGLSHRGAPPRALRDGLRMLRATV